MMKVVRLLEVGRIRSRGRVCETTRIKLRAECTAVMIAMALLREPKPWCRIADQPRWMSTTRPQIIDPAARTQEPFAMSNPADHPTIWERRDIADRVAVMYAGKLSNWRALELLSVRCIPIPRPLMHSVPNWGRAVVACP